MAHPVTDGASDTEAANAGLDAATGTAEGHAVEGGVAGIGLGLIFVDNPGFVGVEDADVGRTAFAEGTGINVDDFRGIDSHHFDGAFEGDNIFVD